MNRIFKLLFMTTFITVFSSAEKYLPILIWHSAGESCCGKEVQKYTNFIKSNLENDVYVKSVAMDSSPSFDLVKSLSMHPFEQIKTACELIQNDPKLQNGYNAIGLSQGGLFLRGLAQSCPFPPMRNLISLGGPQQGIHSYPNCEEVFGDSCGHVSLAIGILKYSWFSQKLAAPLTYWHDTEEATYRKSSTFLAVINNEKDFNANYVLNLNNLRRIILVKYEHDSAIIPNESTWFGYYDSHKKEFPMEQTKVYQEDRLGLETLKNSGRLIRLMSAGSHLELKEDWFVQEILPYLKEI